MTIGVTASDVVVRAYQQSDYRPVMNLFHAEYGEPDERLSSRFRVLYEHPFQARRAIRLVATLDGQVVGFQTLFFWPYEHQGRILRCVQSGNSLVSPKYRGRGIFGALLRGIDEIFESADLDAAIGFPVDASLGSFVRRGWLHLGDLDWYVRPVWSLSALLGRPIPLNLGSEVRDYIGAANREEFSLAEDTDFRVWRRNLHRDASCRYVNYRFDGGAIAFELKLERRNRLSWAIIGRVNTTGKVNCKAMLATLLRLIDDVGKTRAVSMIAVACNSQARSSELLHALRECNFSRVRGKKIHFVLRPIKNQSPTMRDFTRWSLYRSDVDTW